MDGAIIINKPKGYTSRDVINRLNTLLETPKIGHTGTLDPIGTGVLVCLVGRATKLSELLTNQDKEYIASFKLGLLTDTLDIEGNILKEEIVNLDKKEIITAVESFKGTYNQEVPAYSAIKVKGKKLYEYARENKEVTLPKREVTIYDIKIISIKKNIVTIKTKVSKGTYIRSLVRDIGNKLNTYATMTSIERTSLGNFNIKESYTIDDIINNKFKFISITELLKDYPKEEIDANLLFKVSNGQHLNKQIKDYILFTFNKKEIALYQKKDETTIKPYVMFYLKDNSNN